VSFGEAAEIEHEPVRVREEVTVPFLPWVYH
jgi:hypothetical protein